METKDVILELRTKKGLSQDELAEKVYVTRDVYKRQVWNRAVEESGDYQTIAHINDEGEIRYYVDGLPENVVARIEPVSYTHLDVYKRQDKGYALRHIYRPSGIRLGRQGADG